MTSSLTPESLADPAVLNQALTEIDALFSAKDVTLSARPLYAITHLAEQFGFQLIAPSPLQDRVQAWFEDRYGDLMRARHLRGVSVLMVRGNAYRVNFPLTYGRVYVNPLTWIVGITGQTLSSMAPDELTVLAGRIIDLHNAVRGRVPRGCQVEMETSVARIVDEPRDYGLSRWASMMMVEKALKAYIVAKGGKAPHIHKLPDLKVLARGLGLPDDAAPDSSLVQVQCSAGVRYGDPAVTRDEAVEAQQVAVTVCGALGDALHE